MKNTVVMPLQNLHSTGVQRFIGRVAEWRAAAVQAGYVWAEVDLSKAHGKAKFLTAMAQAMHAPAHFGNNWDALVDALQEHCSGAAAGYVWLFRHADEHFNLSAQEATIAREIFADSAAFCQQQGKAFGVFYGYPPESAE
jgi:RNAse (barnase) inhibitor barstar